MRTAMSPALRKTRTLLPGEKPDGASYPMARRWLTIYEQRQALLAFDPDADPQQLEAIAEGVAFWGARVSELSGLALDSDRRVLNADSEHEVLLTRRELQLLEFLLQHPERHFPDHILALRAWGDRLSGDQVRIYVRRLRQKLEGTSWELVSRRGQGYSLQRRAGSDRPLHHTVRPTEESVAQAIGRARALLARQHSQLNLAIAAAERLRASLEAPPRTLRG